MLLQHKQDLLSIFPQHKWDKIETLIPLFVQVERTKLRPYLGDSLLNKLNEDYNLYSEEGVQAALVSTSQYSAVMDDIDMEFNGSPVTVDILSACQRYIGYLTFANNIRIFSSSFNRGGGVNRAYSDSYEPLDEKDYQALSRELFMQSQDALEDILLTLERDASSSHIYTNLWKKNERYYFHHAALLFPNALSLNPYYDIKERRETYQSLVPTIESCQRRYLFPNIGKKVYNAFLALTNSLFQPSSAPQEQPSPDTPVLDASPSGTTVPDASPSDTTVPDASPSDSTPVPDASASAIFQSALPDLLHSLAYYLRADLTTAPKTQQEQHQYLLRAEQHRNLALRIICEEPTIMKEYICGTPLDYVYRDIYGKTLSEELATTESPEPSPSPSCDCHCSHNLPDGSFILDLT